jgi:hypothetical protein
MLKLNEAFNEALVKQICSSRVLDSSKFAGLFLAKATVSFAEDMVKIVMRMVGSRIQVPISALS